MRKKRALRMLGILKYFGTEWILGFVSLLPNDVISCRVRRLAYVLRGFRIHAGALVYKNGLLLGKIEVGTRTSIANNTTLSSADSFVRIGKDVMIAPNCCLVAFNHGLLLGEIPMIRQQISSSPIVIEDNVWIGANCTIGSGVTIASGAVVAANSYVNRNVKENEIVGGVPAKTIRIRGSDK